MSFERIQDFLSQYRKYISDKDEETGKIRAIIAQVSGVQLSQHEITVSRGELQITGNSIVKNEIFLYKGQIIDALHKNGITKINGIR
ncbi:MAG: hypothetical protein A2942_03490 [Candidatus Lloydbacteria bacterium RIFCSPLOWO2_01_FULL_50_20]|uniref:Uncharacterized protein n=1 Tax=Candidatus Lloydbacteria bacterium RIFCSPLOWO2_01_FULL_50_20 TaxID=1798665 RepID=A0A1G2DGV2_9BACT|nr:MAG: hypothetical protein A3C13_01775 [Candidatus Lloydbacteria bacterium RIFCSPHIGHO2_02_FULL_50_11]OGZ12806.1 MAG: hypothetical protein A2942_03490 [Candidatus Lloydbacteria bacterium RIFCSPLOWO2_01_FULL_50_20]